MSYQVQFLEEAERDWQGLDPSVRRRVGRAIERLTVDPGRYGKPLGGSLHGLRRIRSGDQRIVYRINEGSKTVDVAVVCHRKEVYSLALQRYGE